MAVKLDQKTAIHRHTITLPGSFGITKEMVGEKKGDSRAYPRERERGAKIRKAVQADMALLRASPLRGAVGQ